MQDKKIRHINAPSSETISEFPHREKLLGAQIGWLVLTADLRVLYFYEDDGGLEWADVSEDYVIEKYYQICFQAHKQTKRVPDVSVGPPIIDNSLAFQWLEAAQTPEGEVWLEELFNGKIIASYKSKG